MNGPSVLQPRSVRDATAWRSRADAAYVGGGTALQLAWGVEAPPPAVTLIDVTQLPDVTGVALCDGDSVLRLGAATRLEALRTHPLVRRHAPLLQRSLDSLGALSVRHLATLGGNVGWRWGDTLAPLLVLGATVEAGAEGRLMLLSDALASPELPLLHAIRLPLRAAAACEVFEKVGLRAAFTPTRLAFALRAELRDGRVLAVQAAATATRLPARRLLQAEQRLLGAEVAALPSQAAGLRAALASDLSGDDVRARLAANLLIGHLEAAA